MKKSMLMIMVVLLFGFCLQNVSAGGSASATSSTGATYKVTLITMTAYGTLPDLPQVVAEINRYLAPRGIEVEILVQSYAALAEQSNLMIAGGEKLDLLPVFSNTFAADVAQGKLLPLDDLLKTPNGAAILSALGDYAKAGVVKGKTYGLPSIRDMASNYGVCFRKDIMDKYGFKVEDIKTTADVERVFATVKAGEPNMFMTFGQFSQGPLVSCLVEWDSLGDSAGVLMNYGQDQSLTVQNLFTTAEYENKVRLARDWYQKGYIVPDAATNSDTGFTLVASGQLFSFFTNLKPGYDKQATLGTGGVEMVTAELTKPFSTTSQAGVLSWTLPITCKNPEKTMEFLSLMFTDPVLINLMDWGIEGKHYVKLNDHVITYPQGVNASNTGYNYNLAWVYGNSLLAYVWEGNPENTNQLMDAFNRNAIKSKALGFQFDAVPVRNAVAAVANVISEYRNSLEWGMVDVDSTLPRFQRALEDAGINQIIAEKQRQLDAWLAGN